MRLDVDKGDTGWPVFHVEQCREVACRWVDDESAQYCEFMGFVGNDSKWEVRQAKRIEIMIEQRCVLINPIEDSEPDAVVQTVVIVGDAS